MPDLLVKIKKAGLVGRGGAAFSTAKKWEALKASKSKIKYLVCNASEGEPGVKKDYHILDNYLWELFDGLFLTADYFNIKNIYFLINPDYYRKFSCKLKKQAKDFKLDIDFIIKEQHSYISGEESALLNYIEGKKAEPRLKPPYPIEIGLFGCPTLVHNVETLYNISLVNSNQYRQERFYTINLERDFKKVIILPENYTIAKILQVANLYPSFDFFVQVGGDAAGEVLNKKQLNRLATGAGSITIYPKSGHNPLALLEYWLGFYKNQSCGQCTACREGSYRLFEIIKSKKPDWALFLELVDNLEQTSFCGLGLSIPVPIKSYLKNIGLFYEKH